MSRESYLNVGNIIRAARDSGVEAIHEYYDSLICKLIAYNHTGSGALAVMKRALGEFRIHPIKTTIPLYLRVMDDPDFQRGEFGADFIQRFLPPEEEEQ